MITDMTVLPSTTDEDRGGHSWLKIVLRASFEPHHGRVHSPGSTSFGSQPAGGRQFMSPPDEHTNATKQPSRQRSVSTRQFGRDPGELSWLAPPAGQAHISMLLWLSRI